MKKKEDRFEFVIFGKSELVGKGSYRFVSDENNYRQEFKLLFPRVHFIKLISKTKIRK